MKIIFLACFIFIAQVTIAQDSLIKKDQLNIHNAIIVKDPWDKNEIKSIDTEAFFVIIRVKDSVFNDLEVFSKAGSTIVEGLTNKLKKNLSGVRFYSGKDKSFVLNLVVINRERFNDKYKFLQKQQEPISDSSFYLGSIITVVGTGPNIR